MEKANLLIEIGVEEIPAESIGIAVNHLVASFTKLLQETELGCKGVRYFSTPRRIALMAEDLDINQQDKVLIKTGPAVSIAFDAQGKLSPAGIGFLKKNDATEDQIVVNESDKGSFISVQQIVKGRDITDIIRDWFMGMADTIPFPKKMIWNETKGKFIRPLRWIVALLDEKVIELSFDGVCTSDRSYGIRWMGLDRSITIDKPSDYEQQLASISVIPDRNRRKDILTAQLDASMSGTSFHVLTDPRLIETVTDLVEFPTAVVAEFDSKFLKLPHKIITSTISQNQKYFSVVNEDGLLTNRFVFISNGDPKFSDVIRRGNEKVVRGRLADAEWYYDEDTKLPLSDYYDKLKEVVFHAKLGSVSDKCTRIYQITECISDMLSLSDVQRSKALRAAELCKTDLVTTMLGEKEFTKLQGYIGKQYALVGGEDPEVAEAIYEHYMPKGQGDQLPVTTSGALVAIADKLDTVCGIIGIGMLPTGSGDPFALRRAAGGVVQILADRGWNLDLYDLIRFAIARFSSNTEITANSEEQIIQFFDLRVKWLLQQTQISYDIIESVMHTDISHVPDIVKRATALQAARDSKGFISLVKGFKRVSNIISGEEVSGSVNLDLLTEPAERLLYTELITLRSDIDQALQDYDYPKAIRHLIGYGSAIDRFFDEVLVNSDEALIRANRYSLMYSVKQEFLRVADLALIVIE